jgi:HAD superfamily hydrolase (TIGR01509 family)
MIRAILFDFNGVIIDDEPLHLRAYREALEAEGVALTDADYHECLGMDDVTFTRAAFDRARRTPTDEQLQAVIRREGELHRELIEDELPLFPGVVTFIKAASRVWPLGVVSMASRAQIDYVLERAKLVDYFAAVVSAEDVPAGACKPNPACYLRALEQLNRDRRGGHRPPSASSCLVIEDSPPGIQSGKAAGMRTLGVTNTVSDTVLRAAGADVVTARLSDWTPDAVYHVFGER